MTTERTTVAVWFDDRTGVEEGWVIRTTDYDDDGSPIMGRIAMDDPLDYCDDEDQAREIAAERYRLDPADVTVLESR